MSKRISAIYSLPRSGSAWFSMFLNQPGSFCYHEPLADALIPVILDKLKNRPEPHVAFIDTTLHTKDFLFPEEVHRYVLVRERKQIERSLKMRGWIVNLDTEPERLLAAAEGAEIIEYAKLHDQDYLYVLWRTIVGTPFDKERAEYLVEMNIQRDFPSVVRRVCTSR